MEHSNPTDRIIRGKTILMLEIFVTSVIGVEAQVITFKVCYRRSTMSLVEYENEEHEEVNEYKGAEIDKLEAAEAVNNVLQRILLSSNDEGKRNNLFKTHCSI